MDERSVKTHGFFPFVLQMPVLLRVGGVGLVFVCNAVMWTVFAKALRLSSSSAAASVTTTASNFIFSVSRSLPQVLKPGGAQRWGNGHTGCVTSIAGCKGRGRYRQIQADVKRLCQASAALLVVPGRGCRIISGAGGRVLLPSAVLCSSCTVY